VPFGTYNTFAGYSFDHDITEEYSATNSSADSDSSGSGPNTAVSYGYYSFTAAGGGNSFISFLPSVGYQSYRVIGTNTTNTTYYFSDYEDVYGEDKLTTTINTCTDCAIRVTTETTLSVTILDVATTYTNLTVETVATSLEYTDISASETYYTEVSVFQNFSFNTFSEGLVIVPKFGPNWTQDGSQLQYLQLITTTGTFTPFYTKISKDNDEGSTSFAPIKSVITYNVASKIGYEETLTILSLKEETINYEYTSLSQAAITLSSTYKFSYPKFYTTSYPASTVQFYKKVSASTSSVQTIQDEIIYVNTDDSVIKSQYSIAYYTHTRGKSFYSTDTYYCVDAFLTYFSSFTYKGLIVTTTEQEYIVREVGMIGTATTSNSFSTSYGTDTTENNTYSFRAGETTILRATTAYIYKALSSVEIGTAHPEWNKYYTQYSPNFNFVVGGISNRIGKYASLSPESLITKLYFTVYNFERTGAVQAPILAVPIDYRSSDGSSYTYQKAIFESAFLLGSEEASVYQTVGMGSSSQSSSYTLSYDGSQPVLSCGYFDYPNDFVTDNVNQVPFSGNIYYTNGIVNTESGASWSQDGKYYWPAASTGLPSARSTSGSAFNAISALGDGRVITFVGSYFQTGQAFPVLSAVKTHINSYP
jgi:hypothetical protein